MSLYVPAALLLYKFENNQKKFGCVGSCGYAPASVKILIDD